MEKGIYKIIDTIKGIEELQHELENLPGATQIAIDIYNKVNSMKYCVEVEGYTLSINFSRESFTMRLRISNAKGEENVQVSTSLYSPQKALTIKQYKILLKAFQIIEKQQCHQKSV